MAEVKILPLCLLKMALRAILRSLRRGVNFDTSGHTHVSVAFTCFRSLNVLVCLLPQEISHLGAQRLGLPQVYVERALVEALFVNQVHRDDLNMARPLGFLQNVAVERLIGEHAIPTVSRGWGYLGVCPRGWSRLWFLGVCSRH